MSTSISPSKYRRPSYGLLSSLLHKVTTGSSMSACSIFPDMRRDRITKIRALREHGGSSCVPDRAGIYPREGPVTAIKDA